MPPSHGQAMAAAGTNAYRLGSGPGGWAERLGEDVVLSYKKVSAFHELLLGLEEQCALTGWQPRRIFGRYLPTKNPERAAPVLHSGDATLPWDFVVEEAGVKYAVDIAASYSAGLFLDQRLNRARLRKLQPKRVLNTFAYTCSFSVAAALEGAQTLSVDLSKKSLDRGRENFALNGLSEDGHRFVAADALEFLPQLAQQREKFDTIILDPPTYSRSPTGRRWQVEMQLDDLIGEAIEVAMPQCSILVSTNCTKLDIAGLERRARWCAKSKRRTADVVLPGPPPDFPHGHGAISLWLVLR